MNNAGKTKTQLIEEITKLREQVVQFKKMEAQYKRAQVVPPSSKQQLHLLYKNIPLSCQSLDENGRLLAVNQAWYELVGYAEADVMGHWFGEFLTAEAQEQFREISPQLKKNGHVQGIVLEMICQDNTNISVVFNGYVEYNSQGDMQQTHCILSDITTYLQANRTLHESDACYRKMFDTHSSIQWLVDPQTQQLVDVNSASAKFYGYTREQMRQMTVPELNVLTPDEIAARLTQAKSLQHDYFTVPHRLASGEVRQMEIYANPINVAGRPLLYAILYDITTRAEAEEKLQQSNRELALLNQARQALNSSLDLDRVLASVLDEVRFLLGVVACSIWLIDLTSGELVCRQVTEPDSNIIRGWRLPPGQGIAGWVVENGISLIAPDAQADERHFKGVDQESHLQTRALLCVPLRIKDQVIGVIEVLDTVTDSFHPSDLTLIEALAAMAATAIENAQLHERLADHAAQMRKHVIERTRELVQANEHLKELDRLKTKLIEDISHELRTPIANLSLYLDLLERGKPDRQAHYRTVLREKTNELMRLTEDVLNVSRLDLFQGDAAFEALDLNQLITEVMSPYYMRTQDSDLTLQFEPGTNLPKILAERKQMQQVAMNLLDNAIGYTPNGLIRVSTYFDTERACVCFQVEDAGTGIAPEELPYIFDRFYRGQQVGQFNIPGSGLGLAVVKDIVTLHGGEVEVESEVGTGSLFRVFIPAAKGVF